jgi:hypothetical protein
MRLAIASGVTLVVLALWRRMDEDSFMVFIPALLIIMGVFGFVEMWLWAMP